jgi:DNA-binding transcriptional ArsR family regulator
MGAPRLRPLETDAGASAHPAATAPSAGLAVVRKDRAASALIDPTRRRILAALQNPGSATTVARDVGVSRPLANYHVRALARAGLVEQVGRRPRRGLEERLVRATAAHYLVSPSVMGSPADAPAAIADKFSATYQVAVAARTIHEVAELASRAQAAGQRLTTLTIDTTLTFASPAGRERFGNELLTAVHALVAKYHDAEAPNGREYRLFLGSHPIFRPAGGLRPRRTPLTRSLAGAQASPLRSRGSLAPLVRGRDRSNTRSQK